MGVTDAADLCEVFGFGAVPVGTLVSTIGLLNADGDSLIHVFLSSSAEKLGIAWSIVLSYGLDHHSSGKTLLPSALPRQIPDEDH